MNQPSAAPSPVAPNSPGPRPRTLGPFVSWFLLAFGIWSWFVWITFVKNLWKDAGGLAFDAAGDPTAYFWVHLLLAVVSFVLGTAIGVIGLRGVLALRAVRKDRRERGVGEGDEVREDRPV